MPISFRSNATGQIVMPTGLSERTAILGASGQLGSEFQLLIPTAIPLARTDSDVTDATTLRQVLCAYRPQLILNCAAYNHVDDAEDQPEIAFAVNALGARNVATVCRDIGARLIHFSTDAVFGLDRKRTTPLTEQTPPAPVNVYGTSKLAGEYFVRAHCLDYLIVRTCGLYGRHGNGGKGTNFVESIHSQATAGRQLRVVNDQRCAPSSAKDIAMATLHAVEAGLSGLLHLTNGGDCTWFEFARAIVREADLDATVVPISSHEWPSRARRPRYSVLSTGTYRAASLPVIPSWQDALRRYLRIQ